MGAGELKVAIGYRSAHRMTRQREVHDPASAKDAPSSSSGRGLAGPRVVKAAKMSSSDEGDGEGIIAQDEAGERVWQGRETRRRKTEEKLSEDGGSADTYKASTALTTKEGEQSKTSCEEGTEEEAERAKRGEANEKGEEAIKTGRRARPMLVHPSVDLAGVEGRATQPRARSRA